MKNIRYVLAGLFFGFILIKSEAISWYRIVEMFHFKSFHMFGVIFSAIIVSIISNKILIKTKSTSLLGETINPIPKPDNYKSNFLGGIIFGFGWSLAGACTAPLFVLIAQGHFVVSIVLITALIGVIVFGLIKDKLLY